MKIEQEREAFTMTAPAMEFSTEEFVETREIFPMRNDENRTLYLADTVKWRAEARLD